MRFAILTSATLAAVLGAPAWADTKPSPRWTAGANSRNATVSIRELMNEPGSPKNAPIVAPAAKTVDRIINTFPAEEQNQVRVMLAGCLAGVVIAALGFLGGDQLARLVHVVAAVEHSQPGGDLLASE